MDWNTVNIEWSNEIDFNKANVKKYDKTGIYRLTDNNGEVVYIGSAYLRPIKKRLAQYFRHSDSGSTLRKNLRRDKKMTNKEIDTFFVTLKVSVYEYVDLENYLIKNLNPKLNKIGKKN